MGQSQQGDLIASPRFQLKRYNPGYRLFANEPPEAPKTPSDYFSIQFPNQALTYGAPILEAKYPIANQADRTRPIALNIDFFASILGGDTALGHDVVFYTPEALFYFLEPIKGYYAPTTEAKLETLLSQYLIKCSEDMQRNIDFEYLFTKFRKPEELKPIIERAKSILAADESFFYGPNAKKRLVEGKIVDPMEEPPHKKFVKEQLEFKEGAVLLLRDFINCLQAYCVQHGVPQMNKRSLKSEAYTLVEQQFGVKFRKDLKDEEGRYQNGWRHVTLKNPEAVFGVN